MNKDGQKRINPENLEERQKIIEILNKDDYLEDELTDKTLYGEHISTYHHWISAEEQRKRVDYIEDIAQNKKKNKKFT